MWSDDDEVVDHREEDRETENRKDPPAASLHDGVGVYCRGDFHVDNV